MRDTGLVRGEEWTIYDVRPKMLGGTTNGLYLVTCGRDRKVSSGNVVAAVRNW